MDNSKSIELYRLTRHRVGAPLAVARNAVDGVPYGFHFDPHPQPVGAIHESPAAATRRVFRCRSLQRKKIPRFQGNGGFSSLFVRPYTPSGDCRICTTPDHTSFTRVPTSNMSDSLAPGTAGRPVGRFQLALRLAEFIRHEFASRGSRLSRRRSAGSLRRWRSR